MAGAGGGAPVVANEAMPYDPNEVFLGTARAWVFVLNNPTPLEIALLQDVQRLTQRGFKYICFQGERGAETGTPHLQGYCEFKQPQRFVTVRSHLGMRCAIFRRRGSPDQARDYCRKPETRDGAVAAPFEWGSFSRGQQGTRTDLAAAVDLVRATGAHAVAEQFGTVYVRYHRGLEALGRQLHGRRPADRDVVCYAFHGPTGTGKSHAAKELVGPDGYVTHAHQWWPDYRGQRRILIDEYVPGQWDDGFLLRVLDKYDVSLGIKGSDAWLCADFIVISSNFHPREWLTGAKGRPVNPASVDALLRRIRICAFSLPAEPEGFVAHTWEPHADIGQLELPLFRPAQRARPRARDARGFLVPAPDAAPVAAPAVPAPIPILPAAAPALSQSWADDGGGGPAGEWQAAPAESPVRKRRRRRARGPRFFLDLEADGSDLGSSGEEMPEFAGEFDAFLDDSQFL